MTRGVAGIRIGVLIASLFVVITTFSQTPSPYFASYFDVSSGLSNNYVTKIIEDDFGFKWIATEGGLNRYDGTSFQVYKPSNTKALENENIEVVFKHSSGNLWIGTKSGGVTYYDVQEDKFVNYNRLFKKFTSQKLYVTSISEDSKGRIFIGTWGSGLFIVDAKVQDSVRHFIPDANITQVKQDGYGNTWIAYDGHLIKYDPSEERIIKIGDYRNINSVEYDSSRKRLWVGVGRTGLGYLDFEDYSFHLVNEVFKSGVKSLAVDSFNRLWVGTWGAGLFVSDSSVTHFSKYPLLKENAELFNSSYEAILDIHCDKNGIIWISTAFGGFVKLLPVNDFNYLNNSVQNNLGLSDININSIYVDSKNRIWSGTYGSGLDISEDAKNFRHLKKIPFTKVNAFLEYHDLMLVGSREGLCGIKFNQPDSEPVYFFPNLTKITSLHVSRKGQLWIGTQLNGLRIVTPTNADEVDFTRRIKNSKFIDWTGTDRISKIVEDADGIIWIGSFNGLYKYDPSSGKFSHVDNIADGSLPSVIVNDLFFDAEEDKLWAAMPGGLVQLTIKDGIIVSSKVFDQEKGLKNDFVTSVTKGKDKNIWVGTSYGVSRYLTKEGVFVNYGNTEGVPYLSFNIKSIDTDEEGRIFMGATNGLIYFDPDKIVDQQLAPNVVFTGLKINGEAVKVGQSLDDNVILSKSILFTDQLSLSYRDNVFSFTIAPTDYLGNENIVYSYRLLGFKNQWIRFNDRQEVGFTNLKPGDYTLEVRASRDSYNWGAVSSKKFSISTPPWATWYAYLIYALFLIGLGLLISYISRKQASLNARLEIEKIGREKEHDLSEAKITFFTNISHEFRTPLTLIVSPLSELLLFRGLDPIVRDKLMIMEKNASRLLHLINQLLDFRKAENGLLRLQVAHGNFVQFINEVFLSFQHISKSRGIEYNFTCNENAIRLPFDRDKMEIVVVNLLSNAFKYTPDRGSIGVNISQSGNTCELVVSNTGIGISAEEINKVFDRFYQIRSAESAKVVGSGIGLSLSKNIVNLHHGSIRVESTPNEITRFIVSIPIVNEQFSKEDYLIDFKVSDDKRNYPVLESEPNENSLEKNLEIIADNRDSILVVDDNDDIRSYLTSILADEYQVFSVKNGVLALDFAREKHPDLIISDIMMPEMDGIALCEKIKNDLNTSHIPIILLTARTSTVFEVNSLQTGADDFIKKPFNPKVVKMRVASILENRKKLRDYFVNKLRFKPNQDIQAPNFEEEFIQKAMAIIESNINDSNSGLDLLMDKLAMSQSTLYRKIKSLTGLSITAFIRSVRLKKAAALILTEDMKLSQIAFEAGFNDYKYFKSSFKDQFGCLPSEYREQILKNRVENPS